MPQCEGCGQELAAEDAFCRRCGRALRGAPRERAAFMDEMAAHFQRRLKDHADDVDAAYNLALTYFYAERFDLAAPLLRQVTEQLPELASARAQWAVCLWHVGERPEALAQMRRALEQEPGKDRWRELVRQMEQELQRTQPSPE